MKKIALLILAITSITSCKKEHPKGYLTIQGKFENSKDKTLTISGNWGLNKNIIINEDGSFKDTLKVTRPFTYTFKTNAGKRGFFYLANGYDLTIEGDAGVSPREFMETLKFSGEGAVSNNFGVAQIKYRKVIGNPMSYFALEKDEFDAKINSIKRGIDSITEIYKEADSALIKRTNEQNLKNYKFFEDNYEKQHKMAKEKAVLMEKIGKGKPSPKFANYENYKGGKNSLDDFKGKYVYIDMWATWCGPCIRQIPALQKIEKEYHDKNIEFVSISTDSDRRNGGSWDKAHQKWKKFVAEKNLTGVQLWSGKDYSFQQAYQVNSIPRFILIDPDGNIVDNNAPRPSSSALKKLFDELGI